MKALRFARAVAIGVAASFLAVGLAHFLIAWACRVEAPAVSVKRGVAARSGGVRRLGDSFVVERGGLLEVHLRGDPENIGYAHASLLYPEMVENEGILLEELRRAVPNALLRGALLDLAQFRYRKLGEGMSAERRAEIAGGALAFAPDPYRSTFPTYQRFVYLNALYDIALSFEHSPLVGCTTFAFSGARSAHGGSILARAFDFEIEILDRKKALFFVEQTGRIPFASVAWPGLVGVVSGMNREGVAVVVHGGRAGPTRAHGEPVVHSLRRMLSTARSTEEALQTLSRSAPLVSHILVVSDAAGRAVRVERVPGATDHVIPLAEAEAVTNHFKGPAATDAKNQRVIQGTSSVDRKRRADELVGRTARPLTAGAAVALLRDRRGVGDRELPLGDRRAIDALIATHGVVMDTSRRTLWASEAPHLLGRFVAFDLTLWLSRDYDPERAPEPPTIAADDLLVSGAYAHHTATSRR
jgi:hypothetical protein